MLRRCTILRTRHRGRTAVFIINTWPAKSGDGHAKARRRAFRGDSQGRAEDSTYGGGLAWRCLRAGDDLTSSMMKTRGDVPAYLSRSQYNGAEATHQSHVRRRHPHKKCHGLKSSPPPKSASVQHSRQHKTGKRTRRSNWKTEENKPKRVSICYITAQNNRP